MTDAIAQGASDFFGKGSGELEAYRRAGRRVSEGPAAERANGLADREMDLAIMMMVSIGRS